MKKNSQTEADSRERILAAAVSLFARHGYGRTGFREIAAAAGVNLAMINYFFGTKKGLLKEILDIFFSGYVEIARKEMAGGGDFTARLERFIRAAVAYFAARRDYLLVTITELPHDDPEILEHKAAWGRRMVETMSGHICPGPACAPAMPPVVFCSMLTSMMASRFLFTPVMERVRPEVLSAVGLDDYAGMVSRVFLDGVKEMIGT